LINKKDVNGKTLHLVQRLPPSQFSTARSTAEEATGASAAAAGGAGGGGQQPNANAGQHVQQIIQQLIGGLGEFGQNATFNTTNNVCYFFCWLSSSESVPI
jgi:hypothetical protein